MADAGFVSDLGAVHLRRLSQQQPQLGAGSMTNLEKADEPAQACACMTYPAFEALQFILWNIGAAVLGVALGLALALAICWIIERVYRHIWGPDQ